MTSASQPIPKLPRTGGSVSHTAPAVDRRPSGEADLSADGGRTGVTVPPLDDAASHLRER